MAERTWVCQRVTNGEKCRAVNPRRKTYCHGCGKPSRPKRTTPAHRAVLDTLSYEEAVAINGGERCGICDRPPKFGRRLHRDHDHHGAGEFRGLLCFRCNSALRAYMTEAWLRAAVGYVERARLRRGGAMMPGVPVPDVEGVPDR